MGNACRDMLGRRICEWQSGRMISGVGSFVTADAVLSWLLLVLHYLGDPVLCVRYTNRQSQIHLDNTATALSWLHTIRELLVLTQPRVARTVIYVRLDWRHVFAVRAAVCRFCCWCDEINSAYYGRMRTHQSTTRNTDMSSFPPVAVSTAT